MKRQLSGKRRVPGFGSRQDDAAAPWTATERPVRISIVFDEDASARSAEVLIRHLASDYECDTQLFGFKETGSTRVRCGYRGRGGPR